MQRRKQNKSRAKGKRVEVKVEPRDSGPAHTPIHQLPKAVLVLIFLAATDSGRETGAPDYPLPEVTISHVCSNWRAVALSASSLWTFFHFNGREATRTPDDRLEAYLERSQNCPLDIRVKITYMDGSLPWDEPVGVVDSLVPHLNRCRRFYFDTDESAILRDFACSVEDIDVPLLETFVAPHSTSLDDFDAPRTLSEWSPNTFLDGAPSLKFVSLCGTSIVEYRPPLDAVVHLRLESYSNLSVRYDSTALNSILSLPHLKALSIRGPLFVIAGATHDLAIEARSLEHFRCDYNQANGTSITVGEYFLSCVDSPMLQSLTLGNLEAGTRLQRLTKRYPSLQTLVLRRHSRGFRESDVPFVAVIFSTAPAIRQLVWVHDRQHSTGTTLIPFARALAESGTPTQVQEFIVDVDLDSPSDILGPLAIAFPNLSTVWVLECHVELFDGENFAGRAIQIKSLGPYKPVSRTSRWGDADCWPSRIDARYSDWGSFDFQM